MTLNEVCDEEKRDLQCVGPVATLYTYKCAFMRDPSSTVGRFQCYVLDGTLFSCESLTNDEKTLAGTTFKKLMRDPTYEVSDDTVAMLKTWNKKVSKSSFVRLRNTMELIAQSTLKQSQISVPQLIASERCPESKASTQET